MTFTSLEILLLTGLILTIVVGFALSRRQLRLQAAAFEQEQKSLTFIQIVAELAHDGLVVQDERGLILWANPAYCAMTGYELSEILGRNPLSFMLPDEDRPSDAVIEAFRIGSTDPTHERFHISELNVFRNVRKSGEEFWNQISQSRQRGLDGEERVIAVCRDITEQVQREEMLQARSAELSRLATQDVLTGLANRARFERELPERLAAARLRGDRLGLLVIDLDKFKEINDQFGHAAGDAALRYVADHVTRDLAPDELFARMGGDEFALVCPSISDKAALTARAERLHKSVRPPLDWQSCNISIRLSVGATLSDPKTSDMDSLLRQADFALYEVKRRGRGSSVVYNHKLHDRHQEETRHVADLTDAVRQNKLQFYYQPVVCTETQKVEFFETLVRWPDAGRGLVKPTDFLPLAESLGLMPEIDFQAMSAACRMRHRLSGTTLGADVLVSFNCAEQTLEHPDVLTTMRAALEAYDVDPSEICIELQESALFEEEDVQAHRRRNIAGFQALGLPVLLDDFAASYVGLRHLSESGVAGLKLDRSVVRRLLTEPASARIARMVMELGSDLEIFAVAEGVVSAEQAERVQSMGGEMVQGHWLSPAMPETDVLSWLEDFSATSATPIAEVVAPRYLGAKS